jgi:hypothetical protein
MIDRPDIEKLDKLPATGADEHGSGGGGHSMITSRASWLHVMENSPSIRTSIVRSITNEGHNWGASQQTSYIGVLPKIPLGK